MAARDLCLTRRIEEGPLHALADLDLTVARGEILSLIGPSGCGKTAFLRLVAGLERPSSGSLEVEGATPEAARRARLRGLVPAESELQPHRSVGDNVLFGLDVLGEDAEARRRRVDEGLALTGLDGFEGLRLDSLSPGLRRRVAIARALAPGPRLLLLDDPFLGLDEFVREALVLRLRSLRRRAGLTVILTTTSIPESVHAGDRVAAMAGHPGRILEVIDVPLPETRPPEMRESDAFAAVARQVRTALAAGPIPEG
ncbi:MAG: ATP-binding cassette domain-containing protein [Paracoccaceae bacterium]